MFVDCARVHAQLGTGLAVAIVLVRAAAVVFQVFVAFCNLHTHSHLGECKFTVAARCKVAVRHKLVTDDDFTVAVDVVGDIVGGIHQKILRDCDGNMLSVFILFHSHFHVLHRILCIAELGREIVRNIIIGLCSPIARDRAFFQNGFPIQGVIGNHTGLFVHCDGIVLAFRRDAFHLDLLLVFFHIAKRLHRGGIHLHPVAGLNGEWDLIERQFVARIRPGGILLIADAELQQIVRTSLRRKLRQIQLNGFFREWREVELQCLL